MASLGIQPSLIKTKRPTFSHLDQTQAMVRFQPKRLTISFKPLLLLLLFLEKKAENFTKKKEPKALKEYRMVGVIQLIYSIFSCSLINLYTSLPYSNRFLSFLGTYIPNKLVVSE